MKMNIAAAGELARARPSAESVTSDRLQPRRRRARRSTPRVRSTSMFGVVRMRSTRYCDMPARSVGPRTSIVTLRA